LYTNKFGDKQTYVEEKIKNLQQENLEKDLVINDLQAKDFVNETTLRNKEEALIV